MMLRDTPLSSTDFIDQLALQDVTYKDDKLVNKCLDDDDDDDVWTDESMDEWMKIWME